MVDARSQRWGGPARTAALRLSAFGLLLPMALALSAAERSAPARTVDAALTHAYAEAIRALIDCGALVADEPLEAWLRERIGAPVKDSTTSRARAQQENTAEEAA